MRRDVAPSISATAASKASAFLAEGSRKPDTFRTNWRAAARISSSVAGSAPRSVRILLHIGLENTSSSANLGKRFDDAP